jgi:drug/metabolite transporter (DMT)-like permease
VSGTPSSAAYERTRLAWRRTILTALVVAILAGRQAIETQPVPVAAFLAGIVAALWVGLSAAAQRRIHRLDAAVAEPPASTFPLVVGLILGYVILSAILVLRSG